MKPLLTGLFLCFFVILMFSCEAGGPGIPSDDELLQGYLEALSDPDREEGKEDYNNCKYAIKVPDSPMDRKIALTFDDGPHRTYTPRILDVLAAHSASATFFVLGSKVAGNEAILQRMQNEGHNVGHHTYSHPNAHSVSFETEKSEIDRTHNKISGYFGDAMYFRFPYGNSTCQAKDYLTGIGYSIVGWHVDTCDWDFADGYAGSCVPDSSYRDGSRYIDWVVRESIRMGGGVLLFHDIQSVTANNLDAILTRLEAEGFEFVNLSSEHFPLLNNNEPPPPSGCHSATYDKDIVADGCVVLSGCDLWKCTSGSWYDADDTYEAMQACVQVYPIDSMSCFEP